MKIPRWKRAEFEEIEYEPRSIRELLKEIKNLSELIVDLAYSAVLFNSPDIAEEVKFLEVKVDKLNYQIRIAALLATRDSEEAEQLAGILQIAQASDIISNAAADMLNLISYKLTHPILPHLIKESNEIISKQSVYSNSKAISKSLNKLNISSKTGVRILAIRREKRWIYGPRSTETLQKDDILLCIGPEEGISQLNKLLKGEIEVLD
jgi:uncharacterized protein with PhoU and TrkA domain